MAEQKIFIRFHTKSYEIIRDYNLRDIVYVSTQHGLVMILVPALSFTFLHSYGAVVNVELRFFFTKIRTAPFEMLRLISEGISTFCLFLSTWIRYSIWDLKIHFIGWNLPRRIRSLHKSHTLMKRLSYSRYDIAQFMMSDSRFRTILYD